MLDTPFGQYADFHKKRGNKDRFEDFLENVMDENSDSSKANSMFYENDVVHIDHLITIIGDREE
jgi:hypothetical protein